MQDVSASRVPFASPVDAGATWEQAVQWLRSQQDYSEFVRQCYYDDPIVEAVERFRASSEWAAIEQLAPPDRHHDVLELGAGRGLLSYAYAKAGARVCAVEPDPSDLVGRGAIAKLAQEGGVEITLDASPAEQLPYRDASFDLVVCRCTLHHARDLGQMVREAARVLRTGGTFLAVREHVISRRDDLPKFLSAHPLHWKYGGEHAYLLREYLDAIRGAGLRVRKTLGSFDHPVNYLEPLTTQNFHELVASALVKRLPVRIARTLAQNKLVQRAYARSLSLRDRQPGRFYTFVASKGSR